MQLLRVGDQKIKIVEMIEADWKKFARHLHFEEHVIRSIDKECKPSVYDCCCEVLNKWLEGEKGLQPASWKVLIEILRELGKQCVADLVSKYL